MSAYVPAAAPWLSGRCRLASLSVTSATSTDRTFRPEVQGLRAVAVGLVVLYHFWPERLTGGFVGVDVFFVISGFVITAGIRADVARFSAGKIMHLALEVLAYPLDEAAAGTTDRVWVTLHAERDALR